MKTIVLNDVYTTLKQKATYAALVFLAGIGFLVGFKFNISVGEGVASNAPYSVGFMIGLLSLTIIFIATILAFALLFKEKDAGFNLIIFTTPIRKKDFATARFFSFYLLTLFGFLILILGYAIGLYIRADAGMKPGFNLWHFVYPFLLFGVCNALLVCGSLFFIAQKLQNKLMVALSGLLLYVLYMVVLVFSNAPFMAQALPQSLFAQTVSALADPFGLSGYFFEGKDLTVLQRNHHVVSLSNYGLINRLLFTMLGIGMIFGGIHSFSFLPKSGVKSKKQNTALIKAQYRNIPFTKAATLFNHRSKWQAIFSFIKIDCIYLFKSIALISVSILLLFYVGMEMYADIDKGIRLPQHYASSGLLAQTINSIFYFIGALVIVYFVNDIYWRSEATGFSIIQNTTNYAKERLIGHAGSITLLIVYLTVLLLLEGVLFQFIFEFPYFDWEAYYGVIVFNTLPLLLFSLFLLFTNNSIKSKNLALGISISCFFVFATPVGKRIITNPLFRFLSGFKGAYSDFSGYGDYLSLFLWRLVFGFSIALFLFLLYATLKNRRKKIIKGIGLLACMALALFSGTLFLKGYTPKDKDIILEEKANYEKKFRKYQNIPQPTVKEITTKIALFPDEQAYRIKGHYLIKNNHAQVVDSILLNIPEDFEIKSLTYHYKSETLTVNTPVSELFLQQAMQPKDTATLEFELYYKWHTVNGHHPFNVIVKNGSFIRISRYFPQFGYDEDQEITDTNIRNEYGLKHNTTIKPLEAPKVYTDDFINLNMQISTPQNQVAIGTGQLTGQQQEKGRNHYTYKATAIPFRFALSSAQYQIKSAMHNGIDIRVLYHPEHDSNVDRLIENTKLSLDYCTDSFGAYPFQSVSFAEVSSFTEGFAGTAYPGVIFMTENMIFNANIESDNNQDVINELAGHEVSHFWWGNNQIAPDYREGYAMLTESLAMYTEMMIYKKLHGKEKMMERVRLHDQIYNAEKGFYENVPLIKATKDQVHVAYSKGAVVFVEISELIGENQFNLALKNFLQKNKYPNPKPIATDLLQEILQVSDKKHHQKIKSLIE